MKRIPTILPATLLSLLALSLTPVPCQRMGDLMADDRGQTGFVLRDG